MNNKIKITTEFIKLDSFMKFAGMVNTGGLAKEVILQGLVKVNDEICTMRGKKLYEGFVVEYDGEKAEVIKSED